VSGVRYGSVTLVTLIHRRLSELLGDGQWHDAEPVIRDLSKLVPPGVAVRRNERARRKSKYDRGPEKRKRPITAEAAVRSGARMVVRAVLATTRGSKQGPYETRWLPEGVQQVRIHHKPQAIISDERRAEWLRPAFNALAAHFHQLGMDEARDQVRLTAHEYGFHVASCPQGCSLMEISKATQITTPEAGEAHDVDEDAER